MAWNTKARTDTAADDSMTTSVGSWLVGRERILAEIPMPVEFADVTTTNANYESMVVFAITTPDFTSTDGAFYLYLWPDVYVTPGGTGSIQIRTTADNGTEVSVVNTSIADATGPSKVLLATENTAQNIGVWGKVTAGNTLHVQNVDRITCWIQES